MLIQMRRLVRSRLIRIYTVCRSAFAKKSCQKVCDALGNNFIRFGTILYRQTIGIPMGTNCAPLVADLVLFCYERDFLVSLL